MFENPENIITAMIVLPLVGMLFGIVGIIVNERRKFASRRFMYYVYLPIVMLPGAIIPTFLIWPKGEMVFLVRLIFAVGILILVSIPVYIFMMPYVKYIKDSGEKRYRDE